MVVVFSYMVLVFLFVFVLVLIKMVDVLKEKNVVVVIFIAIILEVKTVEVFNERVGEISIMGMVVTFIVLGVPVEDGNLRNDLRPFSKEETS